MYALCFHAVETGIYADMPEILPQLQAMKSGLEMSYQRLGIPMFEYRKFVHKPASGVGELIAKNQATNIEEVLARANITWEALLNLVNQRVETEFVEEHLVEKSVLSV